MAPCPDPEEPRLTAPEAIEQLLVSSSVDRCGLATGDAPGEAASSAPVDLHNWRRRPHSSLALWRFRSSIGGCRCSGRIAWLEQDIDELRSLVAVLRQRNALMRRKNAALEAVIKIAGATGDFA